MTKERKLLFSVTAKDCNWSFSAGTGNGGQARNKSKSAVHCTHRASGATAYSQDGRSQEDNKRDAFVKMTQTPAFQQWHRTEVWRHLGVLDAIEKAVKDGMAPEHLRLEVKVDGRWVVVPFDTPLDVNDNGEVEAHV